MVADLVVTAHLDRGSEEILAVVLLTV